MGCREGGGMVLPQVGEFGHWVHFGAAHGCCAPSSGCHLAAMLRMPSALGVTQGGNARKWLFCKKQKTNNSKKMLPGALGGSALWVRESA